MKKIGMLVAFVMVLSMVFVPMSKVSAAGGFDEYGFNYKARVFVGLADGVDRVWDKAMWGDPTFANGHLVMKWNEQWDNCTEPYDNPQLCLGAWITGEWNGTAPDGSKSVWHYKMIWVGPEAEAKESLYWIEGGTVSLQYPAYEVIRDFGFGFPYGHFSFFPVAPGLGHK